MNPDSASSERSEKMLGPIGLFALKTGIVATACFLFFVVAVTYVDVMIDARIDQFQSAVQEFQTSARIGGRGIFTKLERELEIQASATTDIPSARKQKILADLRAASDRWRPFVKDALLAIAGEGEKPPAR
jgi:hypothetical protein